VLAVDPATDRLVEDAGVGAGPTALAVGYGAVWVANSRDSTVSRVDPATGSVVGTIPVGEGPSGIAVGAGAVWVSSEDAGSVTQIDPALLWPEAAFQLWQASYDTLVTYQRSGGSGGSMLVPDLAIALPPTHRRGHGLHLRPAAGAAVLGRVAGAGGRLPLRDRADPRAERQGGRLVPAGHRGRAGLPRRIAAVPAARGDRHR
jgi:YVTN family beta-propeller protein